MVPHRKLIARLRKEGFTLRRETKRVGIWKKRGSPLRVAVTHANRHDPEYARVVLRQAGLDDEQIREFFASP